MTDEQVAQTDEAVEPTTETEAAANEDVALADAVDQQAAESSGVAAEQAPEVPDDARDTIARAQEHLSNLNMDAERDAAEKAQKRL
ncbi:MAG: hypothetical protein Q8O56_04820 [Solirubrobacteraceae bacterium]|nr:hypothetical protein [Solirubrobacteraceae bacterium]